MSVSSLITVDCSLQHYIAKVNQFPLLEHEEERGLIDQWCRLRQVQAVQKLIASHLRLVVKVAYDFRFYGIPMMDLIQEGNFGLMTAAKKFDQKKECRFSTYSSLWIKASIQNFILNSWSLVKINTTNAKRKLFFGLKKILKSLEPENLNFFEKTEKIAQQMEMPVNDVRDMHNVTTNSHKFLSDKISNSSDNDNDEIGSFLLDNAGESQELTLIKDDLRQKRVKIFSHALQSLPTREREIFWQRNGENKKTLDELSRKYDVSKERIRQISNNAVQKIKKFCQQSQNFETLC